MGNPPPLSVDPEQLAAAGGELKYSASQLPAAPAPFSVVGSDPLTQAIAAQIPAIEGPIATQLPAVKAQATKTASNVIAAAEAYSSTDQQLGGQISQELQNLPVAEGLSGGAGTTGGAAASAAGGTAGSAAGGAGAMSQMMGMPMQMASQMAQMPMQAMGAVTSAPQGVMQGAQQAGQQVQQMVGQFGEAGSGPPAEPAVRDGAAAGDPASERAPEAKEKAEGDDAGPEQPGGRHRRAEDDSGIDL